jgi:hypothetical protein
MKFISNTFTNLSKTSWTISLLSLVIFLSQLPTYYGEDIVNARENYLHGAKTDFWGGMSTLFYGHIPSFGFRWQILLALTQLVMAASGLCLAITEMSRHKLAKSLQLVLIYLALIFSIQMTRDGLMFSFLLLGVGILQSVDRFTHPRLLKFLGVALVIIGMSLRPWLSLAIIPIVLYLISISNSKLTKLAASLISLLILIVPVVSEVTSSKILDLKKSYPEQQVMIMDAAASYCYTNNISTGIKAREIIEIFTPADEFTMHTCQFFRADTWLSLTSSMNTSSVGLKSDFWIIPSGAFEQYLQLREKWIGLVMADPVTYIQNKIIFSGKLIIGSDTRGFGLLRADDIPELLSGVVKFPYEIFITTHLLSILAMTLFLLVVSTWRSIRARIGYVKLEKKTLVLILSLTLWTICSAIAYIGSNGRYTYGISLIVAIIFISDYSGKRALSR